jgi:hypothetical protein
MTLPDALHLCHQEAAAAAAAAAGCAFTTSVVQVESVRGMVGQRKHQVAVRLLFEAVAHWPAMQALVWQVPPVQHCMCSYTSVGC